MKTDQTKILVVTLSFSKKAPNRAAKSGDTWEIGTAQETGISKRLAASKPSLGPTLQSRLRLRVRISYLSHMRQPSSCINGKEEASSAFWLSYYQSCYIPEIEITIIAFAANGEQVV